MRLTTALGTYLRAGVFGKATMSTGNLGIIILAAGKGERMKSRTPKALQPLGGMPMLGHVLATARGLKPVKIVVVSGPNQVESYLHGQFPEVAIAIQDPPQGTGDAVRCAGSHFDGFDGDILILYGDVPLTSAATLKALVEGHEGAAVSLIGMEAANPGNYGRLILAADGGVEKIVEFADATTQEKNITLCNSGILIADAGFLFEAIDGLKNDNAKKEYYLTGIISLARAAGKKVAVMQGRKQELSGVNNKSELAAAEALLQDRLRAEAMDAGVTFLDPSSVYLSSDTKFGRDVTVWPHVVFGPGVSVADGATIHSFCHLEGAQVKKGANVGPFARLRPGADIGEGAKIGNFVEIKKAVIEAGAKVSHLTYIGDARVGPAANIGAGVITCNYDGKNKHFTDIGAGAFIGSNVALVAPVKIGDGAVIGAGSVITKDVSADALAVSRAAQKEIKGGAKKTGKGKS